MGVDPASIMLISAAVSAAGAAYGGMAQSQAANYQAEISRQNAEIARQKQVQAAAVGAQQEEKMALEHQGQAGAMRAAFGASGVKLDSGSHGRVETGQTEMAATDQQLLREKTMRNIWGYQLEETSDVNQAGLYSKEATDALIGGGFKVASSLLSGYGQYTKSANGSWTAQ